ncbi:hypothetical protein ACH5RR_026015 [Cinchona calisaya]|uniref:Uncharacterized protein n=1 Tax=Cinchona calisaya TaxID=153742 RepID=A0ABD2Z1B5_9GENT
MFCEIKIFPSSHMHAEEAEHVLAKGNKERNRSKSLLFLHIPLFFQIPLKPSNPPTPSFPKLTPIPSILHPNFFFLKGKSNQGMNFFSFSYNFPYGFQLILKNVLSLFMF